MLRKISISAAIVFCLAMTTTPNARGENPAEMNRQVESWIEKLASPKFSDRATATRSLQRLGVKGIESLERIVTEGNADTSDRALGILKNHVQSDFQELSDAARVALERIAMDADPAKASAAKKILTPLPPADSSPNFRPPIRRQIQLAPPVRQQKRISVSVKTVNGKREISVDENGRKFNFKDEGDGLKVQRPDDKGGIKSSRYKDEAALKKADKEAYEIYKRYASGNGAQIRIGGNWNNFPGGLPPGFRAPQLPGVPRARIQQPRFQAPKLKPRIQVPRPPAAPAKKPKVDLIEV